jgi:glycosyltransferase involved in cell wall biosynthesis
MNIKNVNVSIITITQQSRKASLPLLIQIIQNQTYFDYQFRIYEWIFIHDYDSPPVDINKIPDFEHIHCIYYMKPKTIGELRNMANRHVSGDIIICMDDDDYYQPEYIEHCVEELTKSNLNLAGCSASYMYQNSTNTLFQYDSFGENHTTNNCMAYKSEYIKYNMYDESRNHAEESSFTRHFTNNMIQLDPEKTVITICHHKNTFDKNPYCQAALDGQISYLHIRKQPIEEIIPFDMLDTMRRIYE